MSVEASNYVEAMKQWLEALEKMDAVLRKAWDDRVLSASAISYADINANQDAITSLRQAIADFEKQEPVAWLDADGNVSDNNDYGFFPIPLYTTPPQRKPLTDWIDPNNKTQERFLPNIGELVLFCHEGKTYYGKHNGGSFQHRDGIAKQYFNTWECRWMHLPAAHGIKE